MTFRRLALTVGTIVVIFKAGELVGKIKGFKKVVNKYGEYIPDAEIVLEIGDDSYIKFTKRNKKDKE